ncbi:MAG: hypothetical protein ACI4XJ_02725 [Eubacteriales bacterium]
MAVNDFEFTKDENVFKCVMHCRVTFDDDFELIVIFAIRYALGQKKYVHTLVANYVIPLLPKFSDTGLRIMKKDITAALGSDDESIYKLAWNRLLVAIREEMERRREEA